LFKQSGAIQWLKILKSRPVWAINICQFANGWVYFMLLGNQLTFLRLFNSDPIKVNILVV
jgi:hypothetical protein